MKMKSLLFVLISYRIILEASSATHNQSEEYTTKQIRTGFGYPVGCPFDSLTAGPKGPMVLHDFIFLDKMAHFDRERMPERVVHARGGGAYGQFKCTNDISKYTKAKVFRKGAVTKTFTRFSTVIGSRGSADTVRDMRGFATKFYTPEGIWDLVGNNAPMFFIRDGMRFPDMIHSQKPNQKNDLFDPDTSWDFFSRSPETLHAVLWTFSDLGTPYGFRHMNGFGIHTFKLVNAEGTPYWCKFTWEADGGIKNFTSKESEEITAEDPDFSNRDLYESIENKDYPSWTMKLQIMTMAQGKKYKWNIFDPTKVWLRADYPYITVGKLTLNKNVYNYFRETEQVAFAPSHMVPGIEPSPDRLLHSRMFAYQDTHRHRLGANHLQLEMNRPQGVVVENEQRDGPMTFDKPIGPNYNPNGYGGPQTCKNTDTLPYPVEYDVDRYENRYDDNYSQPRIFVQETLDASQRKNLIDNLANSIKFANKEIQDRMIKELKKVDPNMGKNVEQKINQSKKNDTKSR